MTKRLIFVFFTLLALTIMLHVSGAQASEGHHTLGVQAGEELLASDVGTAYNNALGYGAFFDYAASDYLEFELSYIYSSHPSSSGLISNGNPVGGTYNLVDNSFLLGLQYNIDTYDIFTPYLKGGAEFTTASSTLPAGFGSLSSTAFGLDIGFGARADITSSLMLGLDIMYHSMFTGTATLASANASVNLIESYTTVMLRFGFTFGSSGGYHTKPLDKAGAPFVN